jgi:hypothetical protein
MYTCHFLNLLPGNHTFRVTDANGCYYTDSHIIAPNNQLLLRLVKLADVLCQGGAIGPVEPYRFECGVFTWRHQQHLVQEPATQSEM